MINSGHLMAGEVREKLATLRDNWRILKSKADKRRQELDDSLQVRIYHHLATQNIDSSILGASIHGRRA